MRDKKRRRESTMKQVTESVLKDAMDYADKERLGKISRYDTDELYEYAEIFACKYLAKDHHFSKSGMDKLVNMFGAMAKK
jgi:hypothetical protein